MSGARSIHAYLPPTAPVHLAGGITPAGRPASACCCRRC